MTDPAELLDTAKRAASLGRNLLLDGKTGQVTAKSERDYVSELDVRIERVIREHLAEVTPEIGFLGEEEGATGEGSALTWVLDPIDGTSNMLHRLPMCGVSLALLDRGRPVVGVIDLPFLDEVFSAAEGAGARLNGEPIAVRRPAGLSEVIISMGDFATGPGVTTSNRRRLSIIEQLAANVERIRMLGSAATDLAWVAAGRLDASVLLSNKPWDVSAGVIIAREAGADVIDLDGSPHTGASAATVSAAPDLVRPLVELFAKAG